MQIAIGYLADANCIIFRTSPYLFDGASQRRCYHLRRASLRIEVNGYFLVALTPRQQGIMVELLRNETHP